MNNQLGLNIIRFVFLLLIQVLICNNILLFGLVNPYIYIIFILIYSINTERWQFLLSSFLLGLVLDIFENTGGAHATACLIIAFLRPVILQTCFGLNYIHQNLKISKADFKGLLLYVTIMCTTHHFILFILQVFELGHIQYILLQTLFSSLFSIVIILISLSLFSNKTS